MASICFHVPASASYSLQCRPVSCDLAMCIQNRVSRRFMLMHFVALPVFSMLSSPEDESHQHPYDGQTQVARIATTLRTHCKPFLAAIAPLSKNALLWRGHDHHCTDLTLSSPQSDLTDDPTYGKEGAAFFRRLDVLMSEQSRATDFVPRPNFSHIGTGSRTTAAEWGIPLTVWPCGLLRYAVREHGGLIYASGDSIASARNQRGSLIYTGLRDALQRGDEVMFQCHSFYILPLQLLPSVVTMLQSQSL